MNFDLSNVGTANTTNLVATLQATGGVTAPSGPQNYGALIASGSAATRSFTFTAGTTCGQTITATFQLQDGATNLGTVTFTFPTGALGAPVDGDLHHRKCFHGHSRSRARSTSRSSLATPGVVTDVKVKVRMNHTFDSRPADDRLSVRPASRVPLATNRGSSGDNLRLGHARLLRHLHRLRRFRGNRDLGRGCAVRGELQAGVAAVRHQRGQSSNGMWVLHVADTAAQDTGTV